MPPDAQPAQWHTLSMHELAASANLSADELTDLITHEVVSPVDPAQTQWLFRADCIFRVRKACRLRDDLELDMHAVALTIRLLDRIDMLEGQIMEMQFRLGTRSVW